MLLAPYWEQLMYEVESDPGESTAESTSATTSLVLKCKLFNSISHDFTHLPVAYLKLLVMNFECWTPNPRIHIETLTEYLQYSITSLLLNLEYKYPFVFSFYGKRFVEVNYHTLVRSTTDLLTPFQGGDIPDKNAILSHCLAKLQWHVLFEFNTLNVMLECDRNSYRQKMCRESFAAKSIEYERKLLKNSVYSLVVPACESGKCEN